MPPITDLLTRQDLELERLSDAQARRCLATLNDVRRALREQLLRIDETATPYSAQQARVMLAQVDSAAHRLSVRLGDLVTSAQTTAGQMALRHMLAVIRANEPLFVDAGNRIEFAAMQRILQPDALLLHQHSLVRYGRQVVDRIARDIAAGLASGKSIPQITETVCGTVGTLARNGGSAELITRMEISRAYNDKTQASLEEAAAIIDEPGTTDPLGRQIVELRDKRNHPFSRAADGITAKLREPFRVSVAAVDAAASALGVRRVSGILWPQEGAFYVGGNYPAHFNERGRIAPWRASWVA